MNKERIKILRELMVRLSQRQAKPVIGFNMSELVSRADPDRSGHHCRTTACMGGWTVMVFDRISEDELCAMEQHAIYERAIVLLDLDRVQAHALFIPMWETGLDSMKPVDAVAVIDSVLVDV